MLCRHDVYFLFVFTYHVIKRNFQENQPALHCFYRHQSRFIAVNTREQNSAKDISALLTFSDRYLASKFQMHSCVIDTAHCSHSMCSRVCETVSRLSVCLLKGSRVQSGGNPVNLKFSAPQETKLCWI